MRCYNNSCATGTRWCCLRRALVAQMENCKGEHHSIVSMNQNHFPLFISLHLRSHLLEYFNCLNYLLIVYPFMWKSPIWSDLKRELFKWPRPLVFGSFQSPSATYTGPEDLPTQDVWHGSPSNINTFYLPILFRGVFYSQFLILLHLRPFILSFLFISASDLLLSCLLSARDSDGCRRLLFSP